MLESLTEMWSYAFMRRAFVATTVLSVSVTPVGTFLVLRRLSLAGEAMAHAITPGIVIAFLIAGLSATSLLLGGLVAGLGAASLAALFAQRTILKSDATLASLYLVALALGVFTLSASGSAIPLTSFLFGSILGISDEALLLLGAVATLTLVSFAGLLRAFVVSTCDPVFFRSQSRQPWLVDQAFMVLLVLNLLAAFQTLGTLMAVGLMILPTTAARCWTSTISSQLALGVVFSLLSCWTGLILSYGFPETPSGPAIVLVAGVVFFISILVGPEGFRSKRQQAREPIPSVAAAASTSRANP